MSDKIKRLSARKVKIMARHRLEVEDIGGVAVVKFLDKKILDEQNIQMTGDDLYRLVDEVGKRKIILNFEGVERMSSAFFSKIVVLQAKLQAVEGELVLCKVSPELMRGFRIIGLHKKQIGFSKKLAICSGEQQALQMFDWPDEEERKLGVEYLYRPSGGRGIG